VSRSASTRAPARRWVATPILDTLRLKSQHATPVHSRLEYSSRRSPAARVEGRHRTSFTTFEGDNTVLLQLVAKELLTGFRDQFGELDQLGTVRFLADQAVGAVIERVGGWRWWQRCATPGPSSPRTAASTTRLAAGDVRLPGATPVESLARRLRRAAGAPDPFAVFNAAQDQPAGRGRPTRQPPAALLRPGHRTPRASPEHDLLVTVCDLFALATLGPSGAGCRSTAGSRRPLEVARDRGQRAVRRGPPHARTLVDAFGTGGGTADRSARGLRPGTGPSPSDTRVRPSGIRASHFPRPDVSS